MSYSPHLRTAVLLSGSGTAGAYHAGVLRALHEAGVKVDVMSGRGIGVVCALFAAIDAGAKTWEDAGVWRRRPPPRLYGWRPTLQWSGLLAVAATAVLAVPLLVLATGLVAYPLGFLVQMISVDTGYRFASTYTEMVNYAFSPGLLPTVVPRLITLLLSAAFVVLVVAAYRQGDDPYRAGVNARGHRDQGRWWARLIGCPWTAEPGLRHLRAMLWQLFRGPTTAKEPTEQELSRKYTELLFDNMGQPGFRELIFATADLETRRDVVFAAIADARRQGFFQRTRGDLVDLAGVGRLHVLDALGGAVSLPVLTEPHLLAFPPESYWKGETHRICDRVGSVSRLLDELLAAEVEQVIVVCADSERAGPHRLTRSSGSLRARTGEHLATTEAAAVRDAVASHRKRFKGLFLVQPAHNPIGPLDFEGTYDDRSDRYQSLGELMDRGYEDAYKQFVEPIVAGGE